MSKTMLAKFLVAIKAWDGYPNDKHMQQVYANDRKRLMQIYRLAAKGKRAEAGAQADRLDTIVRDQIPMSVYNYITRNKWS